MYVCMYVQFLPKFQTVVLQSNQMQLALKALLQLAIGYTSQVWVMVFHPTKQKQCNDKHNIK